MAFEFEIRRPPGLVPGASQNVPMVAKIHHMRFEPGRYVLESALNGEVLFTEIVSAVAGP